MPRKSAGKWVKNAQFERGQSPFSIFSKTGQTSKKTKLDQKLQNKQDLIKPCQSIFFLKYD